MFACIFSTPFYLETGNRWILYGVITTDPLDDLVSDVDRSGSWTEKFQFECNIVVNIGEITSCKYDDIILFRCQILNFCKIEEEEEK